MPIYQGRRPKTWRVTLWAHKKQHEWIVEGTKRDAKTFELQRRVELRALPVASTRSVPTFSSFCVHHYRPHAERRLGKSTWHKVRIYQVATLESLLGAHKIDALKPEHIEAYKSARLDDGMKASSINNELRVLRTMLRWARDEQGLGAIVPAFKMLPKSGKPRVRFWTEEEIRKLYVAARAKHRALEPILHFLLDTGCRKGEAMAARWTWVDWAEGLLRIPVTAEWKPKDKEAREVPISDALMATLKGLPRTCEAIFPASGGRPHRGFPEKPWRRLLKASGVTGGPHTARHTFASHFLRNRPELLLLADVLGHSLTRVTELYTHLLPGHLDRARNAVQLAPPSLEWSKTLAKTLAKTKKSSKTPKKTYSRH